MTRYVFSEVRLYGLKSGKCQCGKRRERRKKFWQTINPFNKNADGAVKSRDEIIIELRKDIKDWQKLPIVCANCEAS